MSVFGRQYQHRRLYLVAALLCWDALFAPAFAQPATVPDLPGPSAALFGQPAYRCLRNFYVSPQGSDRSAGTALAAAWRTLQHANDSGRRAGDCVNVLPGTYARGLMISAGGNAPSPAGYVVYRCTALDACIITDVHAGGQNGAIVWDTTPTKANYVVIDGFTLRAAEQTGFGQGIELWDGDESGPRARFSAHHVWILNSVISGFGQSGIQMNDGEYFYVLHNAVYGNARSGCAAQGSGISLAVLKASPDYTMGASDEHIAALGDIGFFNNVVAFNTVFLNGTVHCGTAENPYDTDGNGIIIDTLNNAGSTGKAYPGAVLVAFNIVFNEGGVGIHIFRSAHITVANNDCFNSALDPFNKATYRPCIGDLDSEDNVFVNNIAVARAGTGHLRTNAAFEGGNTGSGRPDRFNGNLSRCEGSPAYGCTPMHSGDVFSCTANLCDTDPLWADVGKHGEGGETSPPDGVNFALLPGSPAIGSGKRVSFLPPQAGDLGACPHGTNYCGPASAIP